MRKESCLDGGAAPLGMVREVISLPAVQVDVEKKVAPAGVELRLTTLSTSGGLRLLPCCSCTKRLTHGFEGTLDSANRVTFVAKPFVVNLMRLPSVNVVCARRPDCWPVAIR